METWRHRCQQEKGIICLYAHDSALFSSCLPASISLSRSLARSLARVRARALSLSIYLSDTLFSRVGSLSLSGVWNRAYFPYFIQTEFLLSS